MRPKALFLSAESPFPMVGGGALRSASILEYLLDRYETDVFCFAQPRERLEASSVPSPAAGRVRRWVTQALPFHGRGGVARGMRNASRLLRNVPPLVDRFSGFEAALEAAIEGERYDVAIIEHLWCAPYLTVLRPHCQRLVVDLHNLESVWHSRSAAEANLLSSFAHRRFSRAAASLEERLLRQCDLILVTSQLDCNVLDKLMPGLQIAVIKNTMPLRAVPPSEREDEVVFSGNMEYAPNRMAAEEFGREIWPLVNRKRPGTGWKLVGKEADSLRHCLQGIPRTRFASDPEDAMIEIASAAVAVVPLRVGSGTRLKIVEAWASATPVVSTALGAEGLEFEEGRDLLIADEASLFAEKVVRLLEDPGFAREIGANGRKRFEAAYTWQSAWDELAACNL